MADDMIRVDGIRDLQAGLRQVDKELPKLLAAELAGIGLTVADAARAKVPRVSGAAGASIKVKKDQRGSSLAVGGTKAPWYPWLEFGGGVGRNKMVRRPFIKKGRYIFPTLAEKRPELEEKVDEALERLARLAGFDTKGTA